MLGKSRILKGAEVLDSKYQAISDSIGKKNIKVTTMAGKVNHFDGKPLAGDELGARSCRRLQLRHVGLLPLLQGGRHRSGNDRAWIIPRMC